MNYFKLIRTTILTLAAAFVLFFTPVDENKASASAASVDELKSVTSKYLGVRYAYGGTTSKGFDCSGYVRQVFKEVGIATLDRTTTGMYGQGTAVKKSDLQEGDLVFFNTTGKGVSHVGIYIGDGEFIHASTSQGVMKSDVDDRAYWGNKYIGAKRIASFTPEAE